MELVHTLDPIGSQDGSLVHRHDTQQGTQDAHLGFTQDDELERQIRPEERERGAGEWGRRE